MLEGERKSSVPRRRRIQIRTTKINQLDERKTPPPPTALPPLDTLSPMTPPTDLINPTLPSINGALSPVQAPRRRPTSLLHLLLPNDPPPPPQKTSTLASRNDEGRWPEWELLPLPPIITTLLHHFALTPPPTPTPNDTSPPPPLPTPQLPLLSTPSSPSEPDPPPSATATAGAGSAARTPPSATPRSICASERRTGREGSRSSVGFFVEGAALGGRRGGETRWRRRTWLG